MELTLVIPTWGKTVEEDSQKRKTYIDAVKKSREEANYEDLMKIMFK